MILSHKIALDPTRKQEQYFRRAAGTARFVWNWALAQGKALSEQGENPHVQQLKKLWNTIKRDEYPWVYEVAKDVNQQPFTNLHKAFTRFFTGEAGYPNFKRKGIHDSFYVSNDKLKVAGTRFYVPRLGWVKMREELRFDGKILGATLSRVADRWFVSMQVEVGDYRRERTDDGIVGVALGVTTLATLSTRTLRCDCGLFIDRDVNAAINLARVGYTRSHACGDTSGGGTMAASVYESCVVEAGTTPCALLPTM